MCVLTGKRRQVLVSVDGVIQDVVGVIIVVVMTTSFHFLACLFIRLVVFFSW